MTHQPGRQFRVVETLVQATRTYGCSVPLAIAPPHGHATTSVGSSGFSAGLVSLPDIHGLPLDDSSGDADSKVDAHPPYPIQISVCPQSRQTPDLGTPASQLPAVGHTQDRAATRPAAVKPHHFLDAENAFLNREEDPPHSSWASCSGPPAPMHYTNATADLSTCNGTPATFGHNDCQDRDDTERTRPVTPPSVPPSPDLRPPFVPLEHAYAAYGDSLHTSATMSFFYGIHCAEQFMMASKARLFGDDTALSATLASDDPREQKRVGRHVRHFDHDFWQQECENSSLRGNLTKFSRNEKMRPALVHTVPTPPCRSEPP